MKMERWMQHAQTHTHWDHSLSTLLQSKNWVVQIGQVGAVELHTRTGGFEKKTEQSWKEQDTEMGPWEWTESRGDPLSRLHLAIIRRWTACSGPHTAHDEDFKEEHSNLLSYPHTEMREMKGKLWVLVIPKVPIKAAAIDYLTIPTQIRNMCVLLEKQ